ncbi:MAG: response regulator [Phycisphaerales bacterium]|nr:response regulator [Phycisphaerales bacterium]
MAKRILLVDDDSDYLLSMQVQLERAGYAVTTAEGVASAKAQMAALRPDAAIIDLMMEETDGGFALCYHIKKLDPAIPVIMVSAVESETGLEFDATAPGERSWLKADAFLAKPVRFEQLQRELERLVPKQVAP